MSLVRSIKEVILIVFNGEKIMRYAEVPSYFLKDQDAKSENLSSLTVDGRRILKSYDDVVAFFQNAELYIEGSSRSPTTQKHINCLMHLCCCRKQKATIINHNTTPKIKNILAKYLIRKANGESVCPEQVTDSIATFMEATESKDYNAFDKIFRGNALNKVLRERLNEENSLGLFRPDKKELLDMVEDWMEAEKTIDCLLDMRARGEYGKVWQIYNARKCKQFDSELSLLKSSE
jgi:hypothetical protein